MFPPQEMSARAHRSAVNKALGFIGSRLLRVDGIVPDHAVQIPEPVGEPGAEFAVLLGMDIAVDSPAVHVGLRRRPDQGFRLGQAVQQARQQGIR